MSDEHERNPVSNRTMATRERADLAVSLLDRAAGEVKKLADLLRDHPFGEANTLGRAQEALDGIATSDKVRARPCMIPMEAA